MIYDVKIYIGNSPHYMQLNEEQLNIFRKEISDTSAPEFIEFHCLDSDCVFAIRREEVEAYSYKEVGDE